MKTDMIELSAFLKKFSVSFPECSSANPWEIVQNLPSILLTKIKSCSSEYTIKGDIAIHHTANIEAHCVIKGPAIISQGVFVGAHAYLRGGVFLDNNVTIGPGSEIKSSIILANSALAHFNFVGDSIIGSNVNMEAGSVIANHFNERNDKTIFIMINGTRMAIDSQKFGALVGDHTKIGANAVLSPGTILPIQSIVKRLQLVEQCP